MKRFWFENTYLRELPSGTRGTLWMVLACLMFGALAVLIRRVAQQVPPFEIIFFRNLVQVIFFAPWLAVRGFSVMRTARIKTHVTRSAIGVMAMVCFFPALAVLPAAQAIAISFTTPLFATIGAALFLREHVRARRWTAIVIGLVGVMVILRPEAAAVGRAQGLVVLSAMFMAGSILLTKSMTRTDDPNVIAAYTGALMTVFSLPLALAVWRTPDLEQGKWLLALGLTATLGQVAFNRAFSHADASAIMALDFLRLPVGAIIAFVLLGERPDRWTIVGAVVIFSSSLYIARREARMARRVRHAQAMTLDPSVVAEGPIQKVRPEAHND
ncbi:DMT family transporter [Varunaivibrio sulfuroxidans]|uniref:Drug/metabolite transporter (DMT)-like permease n=1 Tax=Varunaivibrio sulfuroxidans TaxID=1773489 RepID=A0A4R3JH05_9PROT|nr:DMT family transporter [Varunaivibrio sulfuroxidans]TCS64775.1 drug/metabolite transporter (DMT)-like permease [Varunaivibrio sulfuroxidans]WES29920.1 DMT family transporter [Varunaivibrio sulfuroxidans]